MTNFPGRMDNGEEKEKDKDKEPPEFLMQRFIKSRTILISGEINKQLSETVVRQLLILEAESDEPIKIFIDSPGGDVYAGFSVFDMIRYVKPTVHIIGMGLVASAAALILLATPRERRIGLPNSHYLIHQPLSGIRGVATEIEIHAREIEKLRQKINKIIAEETGQDYEKVVNDTDRDYWVTSGEAVEYGLISRVIRTSEELGI